MISLILAMSLNNSIGKAGKMPWHLPNDLKYFRKLTENNVVIMGRKTYESIGRALPNRKNIILTRDENYIADNCHIYNSIEDLMVDYKYNDGEEIFVIGGSELYNQFIDYADRIYITRIYENFDADTYFECNIDDWKIVKREIGNINENNKHYHEFLIYERNNNV